MIKQYSNTEILRILGERLRKYRINQELTQKALAEKAGVSVMTVHKLETGTATNITAVNLFSILRHCGLVENLDALVPDTDEYPFSSLSPKQRYKKSTRQCR